MKEGHSAYDYYNRYKINKKRCGRNKTSLTQSEKNFIQTHYFSELLEKSSLI